MTVTFKQAKSALLALAFVATTLVTAASATAPVAAFGGGGQGGKQDCPDGTVQLAKFNYEKEWSWSQWKWVYSYVLEGQNVGSVVINNNSDAEKVWWTSTELVSDIVVKGGNGSVVKEVAPAATLGYFTNAGLPTNWQGKPKDISNLKFCGPTETDKEATPAAVTFTDPTCEEKGTYTIPETEGVEYKVEGQVVTAGTYEADNDATVKVTAHAKDGYTLTGDTEWEKTFTAPKDCDDEPGEVEVCDPDTGSIISVSAGDKDQYPSVDDEACQPGNGGDDEEEENDGQVLGTSTGSTPTSLPETGSSLQTIVAIVTAIAAAAAVFSLTVKNAFVKLS